MRCCLRCYRLRLQRELPMKVSPNERRERKREKERKRRGAETEGSKIESKARMGTRNMENLPRRVSPKSDAFFPVFATSPSQPTTLHSSHSQVFWSSFEQAGALLFLPILVILLPCSLRLTLSPFPSRHSPSFLPLCSSALSHLSGVSTSISKKSSRELFVGKCREPAVLRTG